MTIVTGLDLANERPQHGTERWLLANKRVTMRLHGRLQHGCQPRHERVQCKQFHGMPAILARRIAVSIAGRNGLWSGRSQIDSSGMNGAKTCSAAVKSPSGQF